MVGGCGALFSGDGKRGEHLQEESGDTYARMMENSTRQLIGIVKEFVKHCFGAKSQ